MAILNFTPGDKLASTVIDSGWYTAVLETIDGPKKSGSGKSVNFFNDFKITKGPFVETFAQALMWGSANQAGGSLLTPYISPINGSSGIEPLWEIISNTVTEIRGATRIERE